MAWTSFSCSLRVQGRLCPWGIGLGSEATVREQKVCAGSTQGMLPPSDGIPDARVRVIARDSRFQNSSSGADRVFSIAP